MSRQLEDPAESARWEAAMVASEQRRAAAAQRADTATTDMVDAYGFQWGPVVVQRAAALARGEHALTRVLRIISDRPGQNLSVYISPTGARIRVFRGGRELT